MRDRPVNLRLPVPVQELSLTVFITYMQVQGTIVRNTGEVVQHPLTDFGNLGYLLLIVSGLAVSVRRRWPVPVFAATALASLVYYGLGFPDGPTWLALFLAAYTVAAYGDGRRSLVIVGGGITVLAVFWLVAAADVEPRAAIGWVYFRIGASVMSAALGESVRTRRVLAVEAQERAELAERTRDEVARARVDAERLRIAREVHDTVAHAIAVINVQAGVTAHVLDRKPEQAREALRTIEQTSSRALSEMRAVLGVLRGDDSDDERAPQPGVGEIGDLIRQAREAGLEVTVEDNLPATPLPGAVAAAAYRIVQESITNVIRHVGPTRVTIALDRAAEVVRIRVTDCGRTDSGAVLAPDGVAPGRGIIGMRERCRLLGGELQARPTSAGGFEVLARLPVVPAEARL
ncbi:sensor histidine kinase [Nocardia huaxiensis]|uniref:histidine kinase n=1 Tax=Nocardia huaxiensis TaxID=2755382 RepID=A0A7D6V7S2_9NOCA|nr:sensor histidine kinase [Nocardia huaxiensis]QLY29601.1 sensor histidine kinase [Nocardia huaxiensis]